MARGDRGLGVGGAGGFVGCVVSELLLFFVLVECWVLKRGCLCANVRLGEQVRVFVWGLGGV